MPAAPTIPAPSAKPAAPAAGFCYACICLYWPIFAYMRCTPRTGPRYPVGEGHAPPGSAPAPRTGPVKTVKSPQVCHCEEQRDVAP